MNNSNLNQKNTHPVLLEAIEGKILENYIEYQYLFLEFQSNFLSNLYNRYQSIENGTLVLYCARQAHQDILRKKDYDLDFNLSFEKFWENHSELIPKRRSLISIAKDTLLPKETVRRKILQKVKKKVISKKNKNICWLPSEQYKQNYNLVISKEIEDISRLMSFVSKKIDTPFSKEEIKNEIKEKFSFYWFHYLEVQLEYLRSWTKQFNDMELGLIFLQVANVFASKAKEKKISHKDIYDDPSLFKEFLGASVSATFISEVTKIPRATCVRKLDILVKSKILTQDQISKRYYINPSATADNMILQKQTEKVVKLFSNFYFISLRAINTKILNR